MSGEQQLEIAEHAIQLSYIGTREIHFESVQLPSTIEFSKIDAPNVSVGRSNYDAVEKTIQVTASVEVREKQAPQAGLTEESSFCLRVTLVAQFSVDEESFPADKVNDWADRAAYYILFPFLREEVFSLTSRVGMRPIILPLLQIPTFKVESPGGASAVSAGALGHDLRLGATQAK